MYIWITKILVLLLLLTFTLLFGLLPIFIIRCIRAKQSRIRAFDKHRLEFMLSLLSCFAGGVFLGTTLLHLLPEVREDMLDLLEFYGIKTNFAVAEASISVGFFMIMIIENLIMVLQHHQKKRPFDSVESSISCDHEAKVERSIKEENEPMLRSNPKLKSYGAVATGCTSDPPHEHSDEEKEDHETHSHHPHHRIVTEDKSKEPPERIHSHTNCRDNEHCHCPIVVQTGDCVHVIHPSHHQHHHQEASQLGSIRSFMLLLALSVHTVFEGLALGLQQHNTDVWNLFIAIIFHKSVIAFSMGVQFAEQLKSFRNAVAFIILFAIMSPIGVVIGTVIVALQGTGESALVSVIFQAIAAGTFLYVTFFEVLQREVGMDHSLLKVLLVILGFGAMVILNLFNGEQSH